MLDFTVLPVKSWEVVNPDAVIVSRIFETA